jgi:hypothetical protein
MSFAKPKRWKDNIKPDPTQRAEGGWSWLRIMSNVVL